MFFYLAFHLTPYQKNLPDVNGEKVDPRHR